MQNPNRQYSFYLKSAKIFATLLVSLIVLGAICFYKQIRFDALWEEWSKTNHTILILVIIFSAMFHIFIGAHKLWRIMQAMGVDIGYREMLLVRLGAGPLRLLIPLKAGELVNILYFYHHKKMPFGRASGAIIFDKGLNLIGVTYWLLLGLVLLTELSSLNQIRLIAALGASYILFFFCVPLHNFIIHIAVRTHPKIGRFTEGVLAPFREFTVKKKLYFVAYGMFFNLRPLVVCFFLFVAYGVNISTVQVLARTPIAILASHIPGALAGIGPREWAIGEMYSDFASKEIVLSVGLLMSLTVHIIPMILGIPWVSWFLKRLIKQEPVAEVDS